MTTLLFASRSGRAYDEVTVVPVVLSCIRSRWGATVLAPDWRARATKQMQDMEWLRFRNGYLPMALAQELDDYVLACVCNI